MKEISLEEKVIFVFLIGLCIMGVFIYFWPESFFAVYDKILNFLKL